MNGYQDEQARCQTDTEAIYQSVKINYQNRIAKNRELKTIPYMISNQKNI